MKHKTINGWTKEKMKAQIRLKNNGTRAHDGDSCKYMTPDGNRCAVGCFIPDDQFSEGLLESTDVTDLLIRYKHLKEYMPLEDRGLTFMQGEHDSGYDVAEATGLHERLCAWIDQNVEDSEVAGG